MLGMVMLTFAFLAGVLVGCGAAMRFTDALADALGATFTISDHEERAELIAARLIAAGVRVTGDAGLREAAQAVVDAAKETPDALGRPSVVFGDVMDAIAALRAALATELQP